jgi:hypothetical protein
LTYIAPVNSNFDKVVLGKRLTQNWEDLTIQHVLNLTLKESQMLSRGDFEAIFGAFAKAKVGIAGGQATVGGQVHQITGDEDQAVQLMKEAFKRLESNPDLFSGDPNGAYTYDDPILANIVAFVRAGIDAPVGVAGPPGADLWNRSWFRWAMVGVHAWLSRGNRALATLGGITPTHSITLATPAAPVARLAIIGDAGYAGLAQQT